jgi:fatty-acyl-CoA synthase
MRYESGPRVVDTSYLIRRAEACYGGLEAVSDGVRSLTFSELVTRAERLAATFERAGIPQGAAIGVLSENRTEYIEVDVAIALARRVRVALNARLHLEDHRFVATDSDMRVLFHSSRYAEDATTLAEQLGIVAISMDSPSGSSLDMDTLISESNPEAIPRTGDVEQPAWITYTSGTTGRPKGIVLSVRSIREVAFNLLLELGPVRPGDRLVLPQPLSHGAGYFVLPWLLSGAELRVMRQFDPEEAWAAAAPRPGRATTFKCVPAMIPTLIDGHSPDARAYDTIVYGAAPMPRPVLEAALDRFGPILTQIYGQSEAPVTLTCLHKRDHEGDGGQRFSAGRPFRPVGIEVRDDSGQVLPVGESGEVAVTGSHVMTGYHGLPDETARVLKDGWIMTKDIGVVDEQGFLYLLGRRDEMINSGGFNISPREVEKVIAGYPGVEEVTVIGVSDERWGQAVSALVKLRDGAAATGEDLIEFTRPRLGFRTPKALKVVDAIPRNAYGKVDRTRVLAELTTHEEAPQ